MRANDHISSRLCTTTNPKESRQRTPCHLFTFCGHFNGKWRPCRNGAQRVDDWCVCVSACVCAWRLICITSAPPAQGSLPLEKWVTFPDDVKSPFASPVCGVLPKPPHAFPHPYNGNSHSCFLMDRRPKLTLLLSHSFSRYDHDSKRHGEGSIIFMEGEKRLKNVDRSVLKILKSRFKMIESTVELGTGKETWREEWREERRRMD